MARTNKDIENDIQRLEYEVKEVANEYMEVEKRYLAGESYLADRKADLYFRWQKTSERIKKDIEKLKEELSEYSRDPESYRRKQEIIERKCAEQESLKKKQEENKKRVEQEERDRRWNEYTDLKNRLVKRRRILLPVAIILQTFVLATMLFLAYNICLIIETTFNVEWAFWGSEQMISTLVFMAISLLAFCLIVFRDGYYPKLRVFGMIVVIGISLWYIYLISQSYFHVYSNGKWGDVIGDFTFDLLRDNFDATLLYFAIIILGSFVSSIIAYANPKRVWRSACLFWGKG